MRRVVVIGCSGAGKSTLARRLGERTGLPVVHLDREDWRPGGGEPPRGDWRARVAALAADESWIMDGQYGGTLDLRLA
ncbi:AAA family ATPase, partial [Acinetobacter baumannii]